MTTKRQSGRTEKMPVSILDAVETAGPNIDKVKDVSYRAMAQIGLEGFGRDESSSLSVSSAEMTALERTRFEETGAVSYYD